MKEKVKNYIKESIGYSFLIDWSHKVRLHNGRVSLNQIMKVLIEKSKKDDIFERANAVAFNFTLSIFPTIIFLFTLIPYIPVASLDARIMDFLYQVMPHSIYEVAFNTIDDIVSKPRGGLLSFGFFFALYMATNGMMSLMKAFNQSYKTEEKRGYLKTLIIAVALTVLLAFVLFLAIMLLIVGQQIIDKVHALGIVTEEYVFRILVAVRLGVLFFMFLVAISSIYYLAPAVVKRWKFLSPGSVLASVLCILVSFGFSFYINNFATYNKLYGSIGALIALMIWLSFLSVVLLLGFELNASIDQVLHNVRRKKLKRAKVADDY